MSKKFTAIAICLAVLLITTSAFAEKPKIQMPTYPEPFKMIPDDTIASGVTKYTLYFKQKPDDMVATLKYPAEEFINFARTHDVCYGPSAENNLNMFAHYLGLANITVTCQKIHTETFTRSSGFLN